MNKIFLIILLIGISVSTAFAQINSCDLQLNVYKFQDDPAIEPEIVKSVTVSLENTKSRAKIKAAMQNEMPYFSNLLNGTYQATVSMKGYKSTIKEIELTCEIINEQNTAFENIFLWNGNETETVKMFGTLFTVGESQERAFAADSKTNKTEAVNGKAAYLPQPVYPPAARAVKASGAVQVQVMLDELGTVISAKALTGHPLLRQAAEKAAKSSKFQSTRMKGMPVKIVGVMVYNFVP